eukprot:4836275-Pyramimonas_sp.AAC.1
MRRVRYRCTLHALVLPHTYVIVEPFDAEKRWRQHDSSVTMQQGKRRASLSQYFCGWESDCNYYILS